jgi:hypothetical protein
VRKTIGVIIAPGIVITAVLKLPAQRRGATVEGHDV